MDQDFSAPHEPAHNPFGHYSPDPSDRSDGEGNKNLAGLNVGGAVPANAVGDAAFVSMPPASPADTVSHGVNPVDLTNDSSPEAEQPGVENKERDNLYLSSVYHPFVLGQVQDIVDRIPVQIRPPGTYETVMQVFMARAMAQKGLIGANNPMRINKYWLGRIDLACPPDSCMCYMGCWIQSGPQGPGWYKNGLLQNSDMLHGLDMMTVLQFNQKEHLRRASLLGYAPLP